MDRASEGEFHAGALVRLTGPIAAGMLSTFLFQAVDTYFVGQLGTAELAALGYAGVTYLLLVALIMGSSVALASLVGHALGQADTALAARTTGVALALGSASSLAVAALGVWSIEPLFAALGAPRDIVRLVQDYLTPIYLGAPLLMWALLANATLQGAQDSLTPSIVMAIAGVINVVLDWLLVFGVGPFPRLELSGAAIATVASWAFAAVVIVFITRRRKLLTFDLHPAHSDATRISRRLALLAGPAVLTQLLLPATASFVTYLAGRFGADAVAGLTVALRVETLALVGVTALSVSLVPFAARLHGAGSRRGVEQATAFAARFGSGWGLLAFALLWMVGDGAAELFSEEAIVAAHSAHYFLWVGLSFPAYALVLLAASLFNGLQQPALALRVLLVKTLVLAIPMTWAGSGLGVEGLFQGLAASNVSALAYAAWLVRRHLGHARGRSTAAAGEEQGAAFDVAST